MKKRVTGIGGGFLKALLSGDTLKTKRKWVTQPGVFSRMTRPIQILVRKML